MLTARNPRHFSHTALAAKFGLDRPREIPGSTQGGESGPVPGSAARVALESGLLLYNGCA